MKPIPWSYSALSTYETCPKQFYHLRIAKDVKPEKSQHQSYGDEVHAAVAELILYNVPMPMHLKHIQRQVEPVLGLLEKAKEVLVEQKLALDQKLQPVDWFADDVFVRSIVDCAVIGKDHALLIDWKTGKPKDDPTQLKLMAATMFHFEPALKAVRAEFWWLRERTKTGINIQRDDVPAIWQELLARAKPVYTKQREYPPKPSGLCKRYCPVTECPYHGV